MEAGRRQQVVGFLIAGGLVAATIAVAVFVLTSGDSPRKVSKTKAESIARSAEGVGCTLETFPSYGRRHTEKRVAYKTNPPTSGSHDDVPAEDREYDAAPPPEQWVHSLEHGRVILQYRPGTRAREQLKKLFDEDKRHMLLMPNTTGMPYEVAAVAWRNALVCRKFDERALEVMRSFRDAYRDTAPERVP